MSRGALAWLAVAGVVTIAGILAGRAIKGPGEPGFDFETQAAPYAGADLPLGRSKAGFTGFGETGGLDGAVILAGRVAALAADSLTLETSSGTSTIRLTGEQKLRLLQPYQGQITPGTTTAVLKKPGTDEATAVLLLLNP